MRKPWNLEPWALESGISIKLTESRIQVPLAKTGIQYLEYGIRRRVQNPRLSRTVAGPDLQIRGGGGGGGHPDPEIGGTGLQKKIISALWASFWSQNKGWPGPLGPSPGSGTA